MKFPMNIVIVLIVLYTLSHGTGGNQKSRPSEEDLELERQLNSLNKPPIKSFKKNGDIIDCIDIYKQPAFDNPLLKDHKLQRRPTSVPKGLKLTSGRDLRLIKRSNQREFEECPYGTVPFRRIQKEDLIRAKAISYPNRSRSINPTAPLLPAGMHYAAVTTPNDPSEKIYGAKTSISVYNLTAVQDPQLSQALLWLGTGVDGPYNSLEYGWTVDPQLYGDTQSRTYSLWTADGLQKTGCYNALCPGYVQVSHKRIMGEVNHPVTTFGEDVYAMEFMLFKDPKTSIWWLYENLGDEANEAVGYWPKELFPVMSDAATVVQLGGKVYSPSSIPQPAQMGSGAFITDDFTRTCYASNIKFVNSDFHFYKPKDVNMQVVADVPDTYKADYLGDASKEHPERGYTLLFGGPAIR
ncbi:hypothetical protein BVRB_3g066140 isoform B [Beta vulgaris subsp. vulgaris]|nr:hypothetical protein BVRB_3g066140 isoform B [Beta vulgaris subsp. vulgaris]